jgi:hypothetical protein
MFDFITVSSEVGSFSLDGTSLEQMSIEQSFEVTKFDFSMVFVYNPTSDDNQLCCSFVCSCDIFDKTTIELISQRFEYFFDQIFGTSSDMNLMDDSMISINKLSVILREEAGEMESMIFHRLEHTATEGM